MSESSAGFLEGLVGTVTGKLEERHAQEEAQKKQRREDLWKVIAAPEGQFNDAYREDALKEWQKGLHPETRKAAGKFAQIFQKLRNPSGQQQPGGGQPGGQQQGGGQSLGGGQQEPLQAPGAGVVPKGGFAGPIGPGLRAKIQGIEDQQGGGQGGPAQAPAPQQGGLMTEDQRTEVLRKRQEALHPAKPSALDALTQEITATGVPEEDAKKQAGQILTDIQKRKLQPPAAKASGETRLTGRLGQRESAQKIVDDPQASPEQKKQAQSAIDALDQQDKAAAARANKPAAVARPEEKRTMTDEQLRASAQAELLLGRRPTFGLGKSADRAAYNAIFADEWMKNPEAAADRAAYRAGAANLTQLTKLGGTVSSFNGAFQGALKNAEEAANDVPRSSAALFNNWTQLASANLKDKPELAAFRVATRTAINEYTRLVSSTGSVTSDSARHEAEELLNTGMASGAYESALRMMEKEANNRVEGIKSEISRQKQAFQRSGGKPSPNGTLQAPPAGGAKTATMDHIRAYAKAKGVSEAEAKKEFEASGYTVK